MVSVWGDIFGMRAVIKEDNLKLFVDCNPYNLYIEKIWHAKIKSNYLFIAICLLKD